MDRVRARVRDKRVLALVKAFLKAGVMTETGRYEDSDTGTPQGGILSPLLANIALSVLDEHVMAPWRPDGVMANDLPTQPSSLQGSADVADLSVMRTISPCSCTAKKATWSRCARTSANVLAPLGLRFSGVQNADRAHARRVRLPGFPHPVETFNGEHGSGSSTRSSPTGPFRSVKARSVL